MDYYELLQWYKRQSLSFWRDLANQNGTGKSLKKNERNLFEGLERRAGNKNNPPSLQQLEWAYAIVEKMQRQSVIAINEEDKVMNRKSLEIKHLTVRLAWHDNKWNGHICNNPEANDYRVGDHSLLSKRLRDRRRLDIENKNKSEIYSYDPKEKYQPPCFWSINAFGEEKLNYGHDNPAAPKLDHIKELLPPKSVFSWPFKLSFTRTDDERNNYGSYYPKEIFENRIHYFTSKFKKEQSIVFLYTNFDNPVSGEESKYCVVGCAYLDSIGDLNKFKISPDELRILQARKENRNFPELSWNIRFSIDYPNNGVLLPYHEYIEFAQKQNLEDNTLLDEIKVLVDENELVQGFKYVAHDINDDQSIFILLKIRKSLLKVQEHNIIKYDSEKGIEKIDKLITSCWEKRGHIPGFAPLTRALLGKGETEEKAIDSLISVFQQKQGNNYYQTLIRFLNDPDSIEEEYRDYIDILGDLHDKMKELKIDALDIIKLASLQLSYYQFKKICNRQGINRTVQAISKNPYLLYEEYEAGDISENPNTGDRVDGKIDLFQIDIALFPIRKYLRRVSEIHNILENDPIRLRAIVIDHLLELKNTGDCYDYSKNIEEKLLNSPLFYKFENQLVLNHDLNNPSDFFKTHFEEKLVIVKTEVSSYYYIKRIFESEEIIKKLVNDLLAAGNINIPDNYFPLREYLDNAVRKLKKEISDFNSSEFEQERKQLFQNIFRKKFFVLIGSPGSGKSFEMLKIANHFKEKGETVAIFAPTGKAVMRIRNNENKYIFPTETIDMFLSKNTSCAYENVFIDESSMVDIEKFSQFIEKINLNRIKRLILVGDKNQLPPIGFGKPFIDIINYLMQKGFEDNFISLETNCRQRSDSFILDFAKVFSIENKNYEIIYDQILNRKSEQLSNGFSIFTWTDRIELREKLKKYYETNFSKYGKNFEDILNNLCGLNKKPVTINSINLDSFQILSPYRSAYYGSSGINQYIQSNIKKDQYIGYGDENLLKNNDKVIMTENYRERKGAPLKLSNGSMAMIHNNSFFFPELGDTMSIYDISPNIIEPAYCITVHKAQGSGFDHVALIIPNKLSLLSRELLYTGLTRSKESLALFIYNKDSKQLIDLFEKIKRKTFSENRRSSIFDSPKNDYSYTPAKGVVVKSRIEYIIYKKLEEYSTKTGLFSFEYEKEISLPNRSFSIHPDFTITLLNGKIIYWEHLGLINQKKYSKDWIERFDIYKELGLDKQLLTTDEKYGIQDEKINKIITDIFEDKLEGDTNIAKYSNFHYSLGKKN